MAGAADDRRVKLPRNRGAFRRPGTADDAPLLGTSGDEVRRAAKVLASARGKGQRAAERSAWVAAHIASLQADIARRLEAKAAAAKPPGHHPV